VTDVGDERGRGCDDENDMRCLHTPSPPRPAIWRRSRACHSAVYRHFVNKDALPVALVVEGFRRLTQGQIDALAEAAFEFSMHAFPDSVR
jgi:hypothetical protein